MVEGNQWRHCSACKKPLEFGTTYWICSVSTCNRKRTALTFCSVGCWDAHLPDANHREAWALERTAPGRAEELATSSKVEQKTGGERRLIRNVPSGESSGEAPEEVLIVASRLKEYIRASSGFNTSDRVLAALSDIVRRACDEAIQTAAREGRKTVLDRDVPPA